MSKMSNHEKPACNCGKELTTADVLAGACYECGMPVEPTHKDPPWIGHAWHSRPVAGCPLCRPAPPAKAPKLAHPLATADALRDLATAHPEYLPAQALEAVTEWLDLIDLDSRHAGYGSNG